MKQTGVFNQTYGADKTGFRNLKALHWNYSPARLLEEAVRNDEGELSDSGAFTTRTGQHTGRSVKDKFTVRHPEYAGDIWWDNNYEMSPQHFDNLLEDFLKHAEGKELYVQDLYGGADPAHRIGVRVYCEYAWHALFIRHLLLRPDIKELTKAKPYLTIINLPSFKADKARHGARSDTIIGVDFKRNMVLIGATSYAGEIKKSVFTFLNYLLPAKGVIPMHCSANADDNNESALFFGLSGTGKTTLSADPNRTLVGDDEHGWGPDGIFNFEGGCYAKTINLSREAEPEIYAATERFGTVFENVVLDPETRRPDFDDGSLTENSRAAYPIYFMPRASQTGVAGHPKNIVMLTCDAFGVMPPIAKLTPSQAMYHYLSGYTAKVAGTEKGLGNEPQATFSTCFGAPFLPRHPSVYGNMLRDMIAAHGTNCWLVNTGWTGGAFGTGSRMPIKVTRGLLGAALDGSLAGVAMRTDPFFGFAVPINVPGVDSTILNPRETWADKAAYDAQAKKLVQMFVENFAKFEAHVDADVKQAAPAYKTAAE